MIALKYSLDSLEKKRLRAMLKATVDIIRVYESFLVQT